MKVVYVGIIKNDTPPAIELACERNLSSYNRFTHGAITQIMTFSGETIAQRMKPDQRKDVLDEDLPGHMVHCYAHSAGVCGIVITDLEYPKLVAHSLLSKMVDAFTSKYPRTAYASSTKTSPKLQMPELKEFLNKYQDPQQADSIAKIQKELDETKITLHETIQSVLERGEKIDDLVAKSDGLSAQSKMFYTQAKKQNSCCIVM
ncbi:synaptobrevin [Ampelomyces quisqualis]|uniref:Synaptobrevin n=1 Tax=Ampelomyces quisqualis TaxID=50730 RepID=A0A6A5R5S5_AMPQU|nr:synaptobrevin [Ampelomyces quisqualis]